MSDPQIDADVIPAKAPPLPLHYQIRSRLGEGGFGEVFEAWDNNLRRWVAIKRLKNLGDAPHSERLIQEARLAASLQHAAFVKIHALEDGCDGLAIVMELVRGQTLKQLLVQALPGEQQALAIVRQIAEAMCEAHDSGLIHGDLKPSNLMLEASGAVRILDFGLAARSDAQATTSLVQADPQGTIAYMAPERLLGSPLLPQSDVYALGVILYELLTGERPFKHLSGLALAAAHVQSSSEHWSYPGTIDAALVQLVRAMTAQPPERRLQTMRQARDRLAEIGAAGAAQGKSQDRAQAAQARPAARRLYLPSRRRMVVGAALLLSLGGAWLAAFHAPSMPALVANLQPYSEAREMQLGMQALGQWDRPGGLDEATRRFSMVIARSPANAAAAAGLAMVYGLRYGSDHQDELWLQKAAAAAQQALNLNSQLALSHAAQGSVLTHQGKDVMALAALDRALALDPENIFALNYKVTALRQLRRYDAALQNAENNLRRHPKERVFADQVGTIQYALGHFPAAETAFRLSIQIQPDAVAAYANLSAALASQDRQDEALHVLQQGLQIRPSEWLLGNLGNILFLRGDYVGAAAAFEAAVTPAKGNPADYLGWANLADTLLWIPGREAEARGAYARASQLLAPRLARAPDDASLVSRMSLYFARTGDKRRCEELLQHALGLAPASADVQFRAGLALELIGERKRAMAAIASARQLGYPVRFIDAAPELIALRRDANYRD